MGGHHKVLHGHGGHKIQSILVKNIKSQHNKAKNLDFGQFQSKISNCCIIGHKIQILVKNIKSQYNRANNLEFGKRKRVKNIIKLGVITARNSLKGFLKRAIFRLLPNFKFSYLGNRQSYSAKILCGNSQCSYACNKTIKSIRGSRGAAPGRGSRGRSPLACHTN